MEGVENEWGSGLREWVGEREWKSKDEKGFRMSGGVEGLREWVGYRGLKSRDEDGGGMEEDSCREWERD